MGLALIAKMFEVKRAFEIEQTDHRQNSKHLAEKFNHVQKTAVNIIPTLTIKNTLIKPKGFVIISQCMSNVIDFQYGTNLPANLVALMPRRCRARRESVLTLSEELVM